MVNQDIRIISDTKIIKLVYCKMISFLIFVFTTENLRIILATELKFCITGERMRWLAKRKADF